MKLILYDSKNQILAIYENIDKVETSDDSVIWQGGALRGIKCNFIVVPDHVKVGDALTNEIISQDEKSQYIAVDLVKENQELKARLEVTEMALITIMDLI